MKKFILSLCLLATLGVNAQNGGQANENEFCKVEYHHVSDAVYIRVTNKQSCAVDIRVRQLTNEKIVKNVPANTAVLVKFELPVNCVNIFKAKPLSRCGEGPDMGEVEVPCNPAGPYENPLPVKFTKFKVTKKIKS